MKARTLQSALEDVLLQGCALLESLSAEDYRRRQDAPFGGSSLGAHYRHVLDHFLCLLEGLRGGRINYDERRRDPELETSVEAARLATWELLGAFSRLPADAFEDECTVVCSVGYAEDGVQAVTSNLAREVIYCVGHAIHHYAIVKLLCAGMAVALPYEFGIAPSTLKHLEAQAAH